METFNEDSVVHEPSTETFYISFKSGAKAFINYKVEKNDTIDLWHTEVPDEGKVDIDKSCDGVSLVVQNTIELCFLYNS